MIYFHCNWSYFVSIVFLFIIIIQQQQQHYSFVNGIDYVCYDNKLIQIIAWESLSNGTIRLYEMYDYYNINDATNRILSGPYKPLPYGLINMNNETYVLYSTILNDVIICKRTSCRTTSSITIKLDFEIYGLTQLTRIDQEQYPMAIGLAFDSVHNVYLINYDDNNQQQKRLIFLSLNRTFSGGLNHLNQLITLPNKYISFNHKNQICMIDSIGVSKFDLCQNDVYDGNILGCQSLLSNNNYNLITVNYEQIKNVNNSNSTKKSDKTDVTPYVIIPYAIGLFILSMLLVGYVVLNCDANCRRFRNFCSGKDSTLITDEAKQQILQEPELQLQQQQPQTPQQQQQQPQTPQQQQEKPQTPQQQQQELQPQPKTQN